MSSNHLPEILKRFSTSISKLLLGNSSNKKIFDSVKREYEESSKKSGYQASAEYIKPKVDNIEITPTTAKKTINNFVQPTV